MNPTSPRPLIRLKFKEPVSTASAQPTGSRPRPTIGTEQVTARCGHMVLLELYAKDPFRDGRRQKIAARDCAPCRQARVSAEATAAAERKAKKAVTFAKSLKPRLPDGARFNATYDASAVQWTGTLTVEGAVFERSASSLNKLMHKLDDIYRASLAREEVAATVDADLLDGGE